MKISRPWLGLVAGAAIALVSACGSDPQRPIDPVADPDLLSRKLGDVQLGGQEATREDGDLPSATSDPDSPAIVLTTTLAVANRGERVSFPFNVSSVNALNTLFAKVVGAPDVFTAVLAGSTKLTSSLSLGFDLPGNLRDGQFCIDLAAIDDTGLVGVSEESVCVNVGGVAPSPTPTPLPSMAPTPTPTPSPTPTPTISGSTGISGGAG